MAVEKRNPLPVGVYLVVVQTSKLDAFRSWLSRNTSTIEVLETKKIVLSEQSGVVEVSGEAGAWYGFRVTKPTLWEGPGWPDIATPELWKEYGGMLDKSVLEYTKEKTIEDIKEAAAIGGGALAAAVVAAAALFVWLKAKD